MKINLSQVGKAYSVSAVSLLLTTTSGGWLWENFEDLNRYTAIAGFGIFYISASALIKSVKRAEQEIGHRPKPTISASGNNRSIPVHSANGTSHIFAYTMDFFSGKTPEPINDPEPLPDLFQVSNLNIPGCNELQDIVLTEGQVSTFVYSSYRRQGQSKPPFSRTYWLKQRRPRLDKIEYYALLHLLGSFNLIVNRQRGRSGKMALHPQRAIKHLKMAYGLQN